MIRKAMVVLALSFVVAGAAPAQEVGIAARVNGQDITVARLERYFEDYLRRIGRNVQMMTNPEAYKRMKREALEEMIDEELLWQEAQRQKIVVAPEEVQAAIAQRKSQFRNPDAFQRRLSVAGFTEATYQDYVKREVAVEKLLKREADGVTVSDQEVHDFYVANPDKFARPEEVRARHILVKLEPGADEAKRAAARAKLEGILAQAKNGADFAELARKNSDDSAANGGDLGFFRRDQMVKPFEEAAFGLKPGEISGIVQTQYGYHIIKLEERRAGGDLIPEDRVRGQVRDYLKSVKRDQAMKRKLAALREVAQIKFLIPL